MTRKYQRYTQEFKIEAIKLMSEAEKPVAQIARELGVRVNQIYKWKKQVEDKTMNAFSGTPKESTINETVASDKDAEIEVLKRQVERLEAEKDILKKAAAYFAKELN